MQQKRHTILFFLLFVQFLFPSCVCRMRNERKGNDRRRRKEKRPFFYARKSICSLFSMVKGSQAVVDIRWCPAYKGAIKGRSRKQYSIFSFFSFTGRRRKERRKRQCENVGRAESCEQTRMDQWVLLASCYLAKEREKEKREKKVAPIFSGRCCMVSGVFPQCFLRQIISPNYHQALSKCSQAFLLNKMISLFCLCSKFILSLSHMGSPLLKLPRLYFLAPYLVGKNAFFDSGERGKMRVVSPDAIKTASPFSFISEPFCQANKNVG